MPYNFSVSLIIKLGTVVGRGYSAHSTQEGEMSMIRLRVKEIAQQKGIGQGKLQRLADMDIKTVRRIYRTPTLSSPPRHWRSWQKR